MEKWNDCKKSGPRPGGKGSSPYYNNKKNDRPRSSFAAMEALDREEQQEDEGLIEGRNAVWEALRSGRQLDKILVAQGAQNMAHIISAAQAAHQGVIALGAAAEYKTVEDILALAAQRGEKPLLVLCDGITDPHNLGAIIRSAEVLGAHGVVIPKRRSAGLNAACAKAAAGALEYLPVAKCANIGAAITELKKAGVFILAADMGGEDAGSVDFDLPCAIVIGAEGSGVSESVKKAADRVVSIPQRGRIQSLNASNAAAILLYAAQRSRG